MSECRTAEGRNSVDCSLMTMTLVIKNLRSESTTPAFIALKLLFGWQEGHPLCKKVPMDLF